MGCCTEKLDKAGPAKLDLVWERKPRLEMGRREMIVGSAGLAGLAMTGRARAQGLPRGDGRSKARREATPSGRGPAEPRPAS